MPDLNDAFDDADPQDSAEAFDETVQDEREQVGEMRTFEELPDLLDVTQAEGDRDDEEALALDADEFDEDAIDRDSELEEDHELDYRAATAEREDDIDGLGPEAGSNADGFNEDRIAKGGIDGLDQVGDADSVEGGEDDVTDFQASKVSDADLKTMGYSEAAPGGTRAKP